MNCAQVEASLSPYLDGEDCPREAIDQHLATCSSCRQVVARFRRVDRVLHGGVPLRSRRPWLLAPVAALAGLLLWPHPVSRDPDAHVPLGTRVYDVTVTGEGAELLEVSIEDGAGKTATWKKGQP